MDAWLLRLKNPFVRIQIARLSPVYRQSCIQGHFRRDEIILKRHQCDLVDASIGSVPRKMLMLVDEKQNKSQSEKSRNKGMSETKTLIN